MTAKEKNERDRPGEVRAPELVFVGGAPRSGTTLVQNMLDSHPEIYGGPEFLYLPNIIRLRNELHLSIDREWIDLICSKRDVDERILDLIGGLLFGQVSGRGVRMLSEKTPDNVLVFAELAELLPDAKFLFVIRDPRAVVASLMKTGRKAVAENLPAPEYSLDFQKAIRHVEECHEAGFRFVKSAPERVLVVAYEELVRAPDAGARSICGFLGLDWSGNMLNPAGKSHDGERAITGKSGNLWYDAKSYNRNPSTSSIDKWKKDLNAYQQVAVCEAFAGDPELQELGYDLSADRLPGSVKLRGRTADLARRGKRRLRGGFRRVVSLVGLG